MKRPVTILILVGIFLIPVCMMKCRETQRRSQDRELVPPPPPQYNHQIPSSQVPRSIRGY